MSNSDPSPVLKEILRLLDPPADFSLWHGGPTINECLENVHPRMAAWRPSQDVNSIWLLTLHMAYWKFVIRRRIEGLPPGAFSRSPINFPLLPEFRTEEAWENDQLLLAREDRKLVEAIERLSEEDLYDVLPSGNRTTDQLLGIAIHDAYHVAQIQLLKRLYPGH